MAKTDDKILLPIGTHKEITREITGIPAGQTLALAWLTVKRHKDDSDLSLVQKSVTSVYVAGQGQITDVGSGDQAGTVRFDFVPADSTNVLEDGASYFFDVKVKSNVNNEWLAFYGILVPMRVVTDAT